MACSFYTRMCLMALHLFEYTHSDPRTSLEGPLLLDEIRVRVNSSAETHDIRVPTPDVTTPPNHPPTSSPPPAPSLPSPSHYLRPHPIKSANLNPAKPTAKHTSSTSSHHHRQKLAKRSITLKGSHSAHLFQADTPSRPSLARRYTTAPSARCRGRRGCAGRSRARSCRLWGVSVAVGVGGGRWEGTYCKYRK